MQGTQWLCSLRPRPKGTMNCSFSNKPGEGNEQQLEYQSVPAE
uniref:Uncharacterized protein n=1 Tax=Anguilla anguilla TaxID=7936 RepID=A0A0E9TZ75_ANGAN